jgi:hypothetical protein
MHSRRVRAILHVLQASPFGAQTASAFGSTFGQSSSTLGGAVDQGMVIVDMPSSYTPPFPTRAATEIFVASQVSHRRLVDCSAPCNLSSKVFLVHNPAEQVFLVLRRHKFQALARRLSQRLDRHSRLASLVRNKMRNLGTQQQARVVVSCHSHLKPQSRVIRPSNFGISPPCRSMRTRVPRR